MTPSAGDSSVPAVLQDLGTARRATKQASLIKSLSPLWRGAYWLFLSDGTTAWIMFLAAS